MNNLHLPLLPMVNGLWIAPALDSLVATATYLVPESRHLQHLRLRLLMLV